METMSSLSSEPEPEPKRFNLEVSIHVVVNITNAFYRQQVVLSKF